MGLMMSEGKFVGRGEIALVPTPEATASWKPVPHVEVIDAVAEVVEAHDWRILDEQYGLARDGQRMFGFMRINRTNSTEWSRCIGIRNSHDRSLAVGLAAGLCVCVCSNLVLGGSRVLKRRHTSRIELGDLVMEAIDELDNEFLTLETVAADLKLLPLKPDLDLQGPPSGRYHPPGLPEPAPTGAARQVGKPCGRGHETPSRAVLSQPITALCAQKTKDAQSCYNDWSNTPIRIRSAAGCGNAASDA